MLTNQDELMTLLTELLDEFYSDEKNKLPGSKTPGCNDDVVENRIALIGKLGDSTNTCSLDGEITTHTSGNGSEESKQQEMLVHLDRNIVHEDMLSREQEVKESCSEQGNTSDIIHMNNCSKPKNALSEKNDLLMEKSTCREETRKSNQGKDSCKSPGLATENAVTVDEVPVLCLLSPLRGDTGTLTRKDSSLSDSLESQELCETLSDKTLCDINESMCNTEKPLCNSSKESQQNIVENDITVDESSSSLNGVNGNKEIVAVKTANTENSSHAANAGGRPQKGPSLENLFSFSLDDLFEDSDFDTSGVNSNLRMPNPSNDVCAVEKSTPAEMPSSSSQEGPTSVKKTSMTDSSGATEVQRTDKDWSMGHGIVDKQGNPVQVRVEIIMNSVLHLITLTVCYLPLLFCP